MSLFQIHARRTRIIQAYFETFDLACGDQKIVLRESIVRDDMLP